MAPKPRIAIVCTQGDWIGPFNLAKALTRNGVDVCGVCTPDSYLANSAYIAAKLTAEGAAINRSIAPMIDNLITHFQPDLLLAGDDSAFKLLAGMLIEGKASEKVLNLLKKSLPDPDKIALFMAESDFIRNFSGFSCPPPPSLLQPDRKALFEFIEQHQFPILFKRDGLSGGYGISFCNDSQQADELLKKENASGSRFLVQKIIAGTASQVIVSGLHGRVSDSLALSKIHETWKFGPSSVLGFLEHQAMQETARKIYETCGLSGFCGVDFIVDKNNQAWLLELNPRIVPATHLGQLFGTDLVNAFVCQVTGKERTPPPTRTSDKVALFPNEYMRDPHSPYLRGVYHDVPWDDPAVMKLITNKVM